MSNYLITVNTAGPISFHAITSQVQELVAISKLQNGLLVAAGQHTTTALIVNEMEERLLQDIKDLLNEIAPFGKKYKHNDLHLRGNIPEDEPLNAHSHLQALLLGNSISIPICNGKLSLGTYQEIILVELDGPKNRNVCVTINGN